MHLKKTLSKNKLTYKHSFCILNWCGKLLMSVEDQHLLPLWSHTLNALLSFVGQLHGAPASVYVPPPPGGAGESHAKAKWVHYPTESVFIKESSRKSFLDTRSAQNAVLGSDQ